MTYSPLEIDRRAWFGGLGAALLMPAARGWARARTALALEAVAGTIVLKEGQPPTPIWRLSGGPDAGPLRFRRGETIDVTLTNRMPVPVALDWTGLDGQPATEPTASAPVAPNASATYAITFRQAGTLLVDLRLFGDTDVRPTSARAVIVTETDAIAVDRDETLLFQDWRLKSDGSVVAPGNDPGDAATIFTANGGANIDLSIDRNQRLRLRLINASQGAVIAIKISVHDVRVMAIDGQPSEPFLARDGMVVLTPGSRVDVFIDATKAPGSTSAISLLDGRETRAIGKITTSDAKPARVSPLPSAEELASNGLPAQLDLKSALRVELPLGAPDKTPPATSGQIAPLVFKVKRGRTVVIALTNRDTKPVAFQLRGHHFRVLDRLDDGWKPFWRDTLAIDIGQTQRIAFAAEFPGSYTIESQATDWAAPRRVRSYLVE